MKKFNYYLSFSYSPIGARRFPQLLSHFGSVERIWEADAESLRKFGIGEIRYEKFDGFRKSFDIEKIEKELDEKHTRFISQEDEFFPIELFQLDDAPIGIFVKGDIETLSMVPKIGVVGTRKITSYGRRVTENIVSGLVDGGRVIVSGLALGVDACAHEACVARKGVAIAVMGNGVDMPYPRENAQLYSQILASGGVILSEYPPGTPPTKGSFPARNRIIAALSDAVVVTEAAEGSGSLITASYAVSLGKKVYAVPGQVGSYGAGGVHQLIREGAQFAEKASDILGDLSGGSVTSQSQDWSRFSDEEQRVLNLLSEEESDLDTLSEKLGVGVSGLTRMISELEIAGIIVRDGVMLRVKYVRVSS